MGPVRQTGAVRVTEICEVIFVDAFIFQGLFRLVHMYVYKEVIL